MTNEEAIGRIQDHMKHHGIGHCPHLMLKEALDLAISALQSTGKDISEQHEDDHFREATKMMPLTLEQLREMDGQPVWIVEYPDWGHWELSEDAEDYMSDRVPEFYGMRYNDPDGKYGLHKLGWLAYAHPHAKIDPGVRQYKEYREAIKKMKQEREYFWKCIDHMHSQPPIWRVRDYIKWRKAGAEL